jgi:hypothetical protein
VENLDRICRQGGWMCAKSPRESLRRGLGDADKRGVAAMASHLAIPIENGKPGRTRLVQQRSCSRYGKTRFRSAARAFYYARVLISRRRAGRLMMRPDLVRSQRCADQHTGTCLYCRSGIRLLPTMVQRNTPMHVGGVPLSHAVSFLHSPR